MTFDYSKIKLWQGRLNGNHRRLSVLLRYGYDWIALQDGIDNIPGFHLFLAVNKRQLFRI